MVKLQNLNKMKDYTNWIIENIDYVCKTFGKRPAGSENVRKATAYMAGLLAKWADETQTEKFTMHPMAWPKSFLLQCTSGLLSIACLWINFFHPSMAVRAVMLVSLVIWLLSWVCEYILYMRLTDFCYKKKEGENIFAVRKAGKESRQRVIICTHADAAYEMPFFLHMKAWLIYLLIIIADGGLMALLISAFLDMLGTGGLLATAGLCVAMSFTACSLVVFLFFINWKVISPGANDNLTGCFIAISLLKEMAEDKERMEYTDVCCLVTDGEECGLRGSFAYAELHKQELLDTDSIVIAADTFHDKRELMVYHRGINFTQKNSLYVCELLRAGAEKCGMELPYTDFFPGATDAEAFSRCGIRAAALCGNTHKPSRTYHTRYDTPESLDADAIEAARDILKETIRIYDGMQGQD